MGEELTRNTVRPPEPPKRNSNTGGPAPKSANRNPDAQGTGTHGTPQAGTSGTGTPAGTGKTEKTQPVGMAAVTPPPVPDAPKKKQTRKPKQKKQEPSSFNAEQISALIVSMSTIVAARPGLSMFAITKTEADQIATPLSNMIAKSEALKGLSEHADAIALVSACFVVMVPRVIMYFDAQKEKQKKAAGGVKLVRTDTEKGKTARDSGNHAGTPSHAVSNDVPSFFAELPAIAD